MIDPADIRSALMSDPFAKVLGRLAVNLALPVARFAKLAGADA